jgi:hypothetical protein
MRRMFALVGVGLTAVLSGCGALTGTTTDFSVSASAAPKVSTSPSPMRVVPVATPKAKTGAPSLATSGSNWKSIVTSLSGYGQWLLTNPDPSLVPNVATPGCDMANLLTQQLTGLITSNTYVQTSAPVITQVVGPSGATGTTVTVTVVASRAAEPVLSEKNVKTTVTTFAATPQTTLSVTLDKGTDSKWRFCQVSGGSSVPLL